jgi:hypothetical protein
MPTNSMLEIAQLQPGLLNIKPTVTEESSVEELDGELRKIVGDVVDAAKYSLTAVAAESNTRVRPDTLEEDFQVALKSINAELRTNAQTQAIELMKAPTAVRQAVFGRYGELPAQAVLNEGFTRLSDGLPPLQIDKKLLGLSTAQVQIPVNRLEATDRGLLIPQASLPRGFADFESAVSSSDAMANESGVFDMDRFSQIWGEVYENDVFSMTDGAGDDFEGQASTDKLGLYIRKVKCEDETNPEWWGDDEIALAGVSTDEDGDVKKIAENFIGGGFKDGKEKNYANWRYHWFSMREGNYWPKRYGVTFIMAEKDNGGLATFLNKLWAQVRDKVKEAIEKALEAGGGVIGGIFGSPEIGAAIGKLIGKAVAWAVDKLVGWLINLFKDDIFRPFTTWVTVPSFTARWNYANGTWGNPWSPLRTVRFHGFGGRYRLDYQWRIYA